MLLSVPRITFDESGNTGPDLLDEKQPVFVLASHDFSEEEAKTLLRQLGDPDRSELKFTKLIKNEKYDDILSFLGILLKKEDYSSRLRTSLTYKKFMLHCKIVDLLIHPLALMSGLDILSGSEEKEPEKRQQVILSNLYFYCIESSFDEHLKRRFYKNTLRFLRKKDEKSARSFYASVNELIDKSPDGFRTYLLPIMKSRKIWQYEHVLKEMGDESLDPAIPSLIALSMFWAKSFNSPFSIVHDESSSLQKYSYILNESFSDREIPSTYIIGGAEIISPIPASGIEFISSKSDSRIKLSDIIAGSLRYWSYGRWRIREVDMPFWEKLNALNIGKCLTIPLAPSEPKEVFPWMEQKFE